jgi:hypothetical protein
MTRPPFSSPRGARAPSTSPDLIRTGVQQLTVQRVGVDLPCSSGREAPSLAAGREAKRDGAE